MGEAKRRPPRDRPSLRPLPRSHQELGSLYLYSHLDKGGTNSSLADADRINRFLDEIRVGLETSLASAGRVYGWHIQQLFAQLVAVLGVVDLIKEEDSGMAWSSSDQFASFPDLRIVMADASSLLVEVKNAHRAGVGGRNFSVRWTDYESLRRYAIAVGGRLMYALYWTGLGMWSLVDAAAFTKVGRRMSISAADAFVANEMNLVGDVLVGTVPPIELRLRFDQHGPTEAVDDRTTRVPVRIAGAEWWAGGNHLIRREEQQLASYLVMYGRWIEAEATEFEGAVPASMTLTYAPENPVGDQEFEFVGYLSELASRAFWSRTSVDGVVRRLSTELRSEEVGLRLARTYQSSDFRFLRLVVQPRGSGLD